MSEVVRDVLDFNTAEELFALLEGEEAENSQGFDGVVMSASSHELNFRKGTITAAPFSANMATFGSGALMEYGMCSLVIGRGPKMEPLDETGGWVLKLEPFLNTVVVIIGGERVPVSRFLQQVRNTDGYRKEFYPYILVDCREKGIYEAKNAWESELETRRLALEAKVAADREARRVKNIRRAIGAAIIGALLAGGVVVLAKGCDSEASTGLPLPEHRE